MWQTKNASAGPKSLGLGLNFRPCGEGLKLFKLIKNLYYTTNSKLCKSILTGKTLFSLKETLFSLQGSCFHYRDFPVNPCTSLSGIAVWIRDKSFWSTPTYSYQVRLGVGRSWSHKDLSLSQAGLEPGDNSYNFLKIQTSIFGLKPITVFICTSFLKSLVWKI